MNYEQLEFSITDGVARIVFANPANHNAVNRRVTMEFADAARRCEAAGDLRAVLLTGTGSSFSVGGDLREFMAERAHIQTHVREMTLHFHAAILSLNRLAAPLVVAVNGTAAGGGFSLVCMADLAIATRSAKFNFAYTRSGLTPDGGASWFLPRLVGVQRAFDLLATNPTLSAEAARDLGIVARVVDDADFEREVEQLVAQLAAAPAGAVGRLKQMLRAALSNSLEEQFELEGRAIAEQAAKPATLDMLDAFFARSRR
ncbi:MAG: enoyl-CoA hydratase/isomerase family protein [Gammaproteobacteria bacterium]|nr:enoyl-CoA hydratase/isomerase family protein [Gammaproteobacteria bacterium]